MPPNPTPESTHISEVSPELAALNDDSLWEDRPACDNLAPSPAAIPSVEDASGRDGEAASRPSAPSLGPSRTAWGGPPKQDPPACDLVALVPGYEILGELGRGGMGVVYKARQVSVNRVVALKMILAGARAAAEDQQRFVAEAEAVAALQHPHIVQLFESGRHEGHCYFTLEFVAGGSLWGRLQGKPLPPNEAARLVEPLAEAMHAAHGKGIIHRDLKPANVLLTEDGTPKITDFGLAKKVDVGSGVTTTGTILGSPSYMAPEQASGKKQVGPASDIYSLGAILYECLTGRPPFRAATVMDTLLQVVNEEPAAVRSLQPGVPRDLETICHKCLQKDPAKRYATARDLAEDLGRFRKGEPVRARPLSPAERAVKWVKRHPSLAAMLGVVVVVAAAGLAGILFAYGEALRQRDNALKAEALALAQTEENRRALANSRVMLADAAWREGHGGLAQDRLDEVPDDLRRWEWHYLKRATAGGLFTFHGHTGQVNSVCYSPDGSRLATGSGDGTAKVWDARTGQQLLTLKGHTLPVTSVCFSPDGSRLATGSHDSTAKVWDARTGLELFPLKGHALPVTGVSFSPDGHSLATSSYDNSAIVWDAETGRERFTLKGHTNIVSGVCFSPDGQRLATASWDETVKVWDVSMSTKGQQAGGQQLLDLRGHTGGVYTVCFSPDGRSLATGSDDKTAKVWDARTGQLLLTLRGHTGRVWGLGFSPDGQRLATGSQDQTARVWDARSGQQLLDLKGHTGFVSSVAFSPDGQTLATGSRDGTAKVWDTWAAGDGLDFKGHSGHVTSVAFSPDGHSLATASEDGTAKVWDVRTGLELFALKGHTGAVTGVCFSPDGRRLATSSADQTAKVWDTRTGTAQLDLKGHTDVVTSVCFSPDGQRLATASQDNTAKVWDARTGAALLTLKGHTGSVTGVCFSPDGQRLATASADKAVKVWDAGTGGELLTLKGHTAQVTSVCFSPDGSSLLTGSEDRTAKVWDARTGGELLTLKGHGYGVLGVCFSPDGHRLATASQDNTAKVWDAHTGQELLTVKGSALPVTSACFSPDGFRLATGSRDNTAKVWDARPGQEPIALKGHALPVTSVSFTPERDNPRAIGRRLVSTDSSGTTLVWDARTGRRLEEPPPPLTPGGSRSPDGWLCAWRDGTVVRLLRSPDAEELLVRRARTRLDAGGQVEEAARWEKEQQWLAAAFHLEQTLAARPGAAAERERLVGALTQATRSHPELSSTWRRLALAQLHAGREDDFRQTCRQMQQRFRVPDQVSAAGVLDRLQTVRAAVLRRGTVDDPESWLPLLPPGEKLLRGATLCRAGKHADALKELQGFQEPLACLFRALAEQGRGQPRAAGQALAEAVAQLPPEKADLLQQTPLPWSQRVEIETLRREVEALPAQK
jgi:WD40 repeat protein/tRNA A-37 threonylcarbamoyl transferase component Bud32